MLVVASTVSENADPSREDPMLPSAVVQDTVPILTVRSNVLSAVDPRLLVARIVTGYKVLEVSLGNVPVNVPSELKVVPVGNVPDWTAYVRVPPRGSTAVNVSDDAVPSTTFNAVEVTQPKTGAPPLPNDLLSETDVSKGIMRN